MFKKGNKFGRHGSQPNGGRPGYWQRDLCDKLIHDYKLIERLAQICAGEKLFQKPVVVRDGENSYVEMIDTAAEPTVQVYAFEKLAERAWGKPSQHELESGQSNNYLMIVNFFKVLEEFSHDQSVIPKLREAFSRAQAMANGKSLQDQGQEQEPDQLEVEQHSTKNLSESNPI